MQSLLARTPVSKHAPTVLNDQHFCCITKANKGKAIAIFALIFSSITLIGILIGMLAMSLYETKFVARLEGTMHIQFKSIDEKIDSQFDRWATNCCSTKNAKKSSNRKILNDAFDVVTGLKNQNATKFQDIQPTTTSLESVNISATFENVRWINDTLDYQTDIHLLSVPS